MTARPPRRRRSYRPGDVVRRSSASTPLVVLPPTEKARVAALWELVDDGAGFDEVLDALIADGLRDAARLRPGHERRRRDQGRAPRRGPGRLRRRRRDRRARGRGRHHLGRAVAERRHADDHRRWRSRPTPRPSSSSTRGWSGSPVSTSRGASRSWSSGPARPRSTSPSGGWPRWPRSPLRRRSVETEPDLAPPAPQSPTDDESAAAESSPLDDDSTARQDRDEPVRELVDGPDRRGRRAGRRGGSPLVAGPGAPLGPPPAGPPPDAVDAAAVVGAPGVPAGAGRHVEPRGARRPGSPIRWTPLPRTPTRMADRVPTAVEHADAAPEDQPVADPGLATEALPVTDHDGMTRAGVGTPRSSRVASRASPVSRWRRASCPVRSPG